MSTAKDKPKRRVRVPGEKNHHIYRRNDGKLEIGYRDANGKQRWHGAGKIATITKARQVRDDLLGKVSRGETPEPKSASSKLKYGDAFAAYRADEVAELAENTRDLYDGHYANHLEERWGHRLLDELEKNDAAQLVRDLRAQGLAEASIVGIYGVANRVFKYARRNLEWKGTNPFDLLDSRQRPKPSQTPPRRIYEGNELDQVVAATTEPWATLFRLGDACAGRESEMLGLWREEVHVADLDNATIDFKFQVTRKGERKQLKTDESLATGYPIPRWAAVMLKAHLDRSPFTGPKDFVFATRHGGPLSQRNMLRALYRAQERARKPDGTPTFPELFQDAKGNLVVDRSGNYVRNDIPRKVLRLPHVHSIRHSAAMDCDSDEDARDMLRHKDSTVTARVYRPHRTAKRRAELRGRMEARQRRKTMEAQQRRESPDGSAMEATGHDNAHHATTADSEIAAAVAA